MTLITAASDLILVFLALEILSLSLYLLTGFSFRRLASAEASMKYFLLGAFSSAFFLYGIAFAYGATGTTNLAGIARRSRPRARRRARADRDRAAGRRLQLQDRGRAVPHVDARRLPGRAHLRDGVHVGGDEGRRVRRVPPGVQRGVPPLAHDWRPFMGVLAAISIVVGSVLAIAQTNIKRLLAYSSIAHAGFILVGLSAGTRGASRARCSTWPSTRRMSSARSPW